MVPGRCSLTSSLLYASADLPDGVPSDAPDDGRGGGGQLRQHGIHCGHPATQPHSAHPDQRHGGRAARVGPRRALADAAVHERGGGVGGVPRGVFEQVPRAVLRRDGHDCRVRETDLRKSAGGCAAMAAAAVVVERGGGQAGGKAAIG
ncbi:unnamed protein product, partial [Phaeothamnion confervicola]